MKYSNDKIFLHICAGKVFSEFTKLKKIKDSKYIGLWDGRIPQDVIVTDFWRILIDTFKTDNNKYRNCKAEIQYLVDEKNNEIYQTGIKVTLITDFEKMSIEQTNSENLLKL